MSKPSRPPSAAEAELAYGIARVGSLLVGFPLEQMSEVCRLRALHPLMLPSAVLLGGLDLRGHMIPVLDLKVLCGHGVGAEQGGFAVILRHDDRLLAFPVDEVIGIARIATEKIQEVGNPAMPRGCVGGLFFDGDRSISVIDLDQIFGRQDIHSVAAPRIMQERFEDGEREAVLIFDVGGAQYAVRAEDVYGTVPRQQVEVNAITSGFCMGSITYHRRRVPVLSSEAVFGLGAARDRSQTEVVVLRSNGEQLIGLAVDAILDVRAVNRAQIQPLPRMIGIDGDHFTGVMVRDDGLQIYTISTMRLLADPRIAAILALSHPTSTGGAQVGSGALSEAERYLVFKAGRVYATPLSQVSCILKPPAHVVPMTRPSLGLKGFFARDRATVPLVDLNDRLGITTTETGLERVLLVGEGGDTLGFRVERVYSIENSSWILKGMPVGGEGGEPLVQLGRGEDRRAVPVLNLADLRAEYFAPQGQA